MLYFAGDIIAVKNGCLSLVIKNCGFRQPFNGGTQIVYSVLTAKSSPVNQLSASASSSIVVSS
jgi:hypothetical protein